MAAPEPHALTIDFAVEEGAGGAWDESRVGALVRSIVARELPSGRYEIALHLVDDDAIQALNAEHRGLDRPTDVLSFPLLEREGFVLPPGAAVALGDVVVSYPRALAQAQEYGHAVAREVAYLVAHGVLHLLGYDHQEEGEQAAMRAREEAALRPLGFVR